ncbi:MULTISPECIES: response regulator transcription factor [unclassified Variovorax]|uniref:response regulator n=1 Tax=unclassified Variovorax TaxID=663243 RepID=UPI00257815B7|nr:MULTISPECIES: response regulator transcription factor [unclassified Variovorax]MDM0085814.1 response regulator transcription factor [Variovorax sp. J22G40]MDM0145928.1 response regulator transcription factor [Variovorax sp. J2P1-31]
MTRLLIIDDHAMFRAGLRKVLQDAPEISAIAEAGDWHGGMACLEAQPIDVLLLDINMPGCSGLDLIAPILERFKSLRIIMLSMYSEPQYAVRALRNGAHGYVAKDMEAVDLIAAIRIVSRGRQFVAPSITRALMDTAQGLAPDPRPHERLSSRESEILRMIVGGESLTAIAERLAINVKTVSTYRRRLLEKMALGSNAQLVQYAVHHRLVD